MQETEVCWVILPPPPLKHIFHCGFQSTRKSIKETCLREVTGIQQKTPQKCVCFFSFLTTIIEK